MERDSGLAKPEAVSHFVKPWWEDLKGKKGQMSAMNDPRWVAASVVWLRLRAGCRRLHTTSPGGCLGTLCAGLLLSCPRPQIQARLSARSHAMLHPPQPTLSCSLMAALLVQCRSAPLSPLQVQACQRAALSPCCTSHTPTATHPPTHHPTPHPCRFQPACVQVAYCAAPTALHCLCRFKPASMQVSHCAVPPCLLCRFKPASVQGFKAREYLVVSRWNEFGIFIFLAYLAAAGFYFWARIVHTLDIGWTW